MYWVHAQEWASKHPNRLTGSGTTGIRIDKANSLHDRERFETCLEVALATSPTLGKPLSEIEHEISFLNSLDPKLGVQIRQTAKGKEHAFHGKKAPFEARVAFNPVQTEANISKLHDAIQYGLPREVEVDNFIMTGSPVFDHISGGKKRGTLTIEQATKRSGCARLYPGNKYSITAFPLEIYFRIYSGQAGVALSNEEIDSPLNLAMKFPLQESKGKANMNIGICKKRVTHRPIKDLDELRPLADWVEQVVVRNALFVELEIEKNRKRVTMSTGAESVDLSLPTLRWMSIIGRLHLVAKSLASDFTLRDSDTLSEDDLSDIDLSYTLLKGEKRGIVPSEITIDSAAVSAEQIAGRNLYLATKLEIEINEQILGQIPVLVEMIGFRAEAIQGTKSLRILPTEHSRAWISFDPEQGLSESSVRRRA